MPRANWTVLERYNVAVPPTSVVGQFDELMRDTVAAIHRLVMSSRNLRATRDLLLPRLISGEVDVSDLDIAMPGNRRVTPTSGPYTEDQLVEQPAIKLFERLSWATI